VGIVNCWVITGVNAYTPGNCGLERYTRYVCQTLETQEDAEAWINQHPDRIPDEFMGNVYTGELDHWCVEQFENGSIAKRFTRHPQRKGKT
jgi:hypothetical protein